MKTNTKPMPKINTGFEAIAAKNVKPNNKQEFAKKLETVRSSNDKIEKQSLDKPLEKQPVAPTLSKDQEKILETLKEKLEPLKLPDEKMQSVVDFMAYLFVNVQDTQKIQEQLSQTGLDSQLLDIITNTISNEVATATQFNDIVQSVSVSKPIISDYSAMIAQETIVPQNTVTSTQLKSENTMGQIVLPNELELLENAIPLDISILPTTVSNTQENVVTQNAVVLSNKNNTEAQQIVNKSQETTNSTSFTLKVTQSTLSGQSDSQTDLGSQMQGQHNPGIEIKDFTKLTVGNAQMDGRAEFISQQVTTAVKTALAGDKMEFTMQLQPHALGKLIVKMVMESGKLSVSITAQNAETQKLLASQLTNLEQTLKADTIKIQAFELQNESFNDMASFGQDLSDQNQKTFKDRNHAKQSTNKFSLFAQEQEEDLSVAPVKTFNSSTVNISV